jgi:ribonuclease VapC
VIVDSSAIVAVLLQEPGYERLLGRLTASDASRIGTPTLVETGIVMTARMGIAGKSLTGRFVQEAGIALVPFVDQHWTIAVDAYARFGKGRHAAALNFGDCLTYAVARATREPLLCVGSDFAQTDLEIV